MTSCETRQKRRTEYDIFGCKDFRKIQRTDMKLSDREFQSANFHGVHLEDVSFRDSNLADACLQEVYLRFANFTRTKMRNVKLQGATIESSAFYGAVISGDSWQGLTLIECNFAGALFVDFDFDFDGFDFLGARNLDKAYGVPAKVLEKWRKVCNIYDKETKKQEEWVYGQITFECGLIKDYELAIAKCNERLDVNQRLLRGRTDRRKFYDI